MATISNRASVFAIVPEVTEGTLVAPTSGSQFLAQQDDLELTPEVESLENAELRNSIGSAKPIPGLETPTASMSHYLRHSGVEGQAPAFGELIEAGLGSVTANSTERTTAAASTTSLIKLTAGGSDFPRGAAMLIKDPVNGYSIRPTDSFATNDVTLGFNLANAPGSGVNTGKCVYYSPLNSGHQTLSLWEYRGNGGAIEAMGGVRVTEMAASIEAGQLINVSYSFEGVKYFFDPIIIAAGNKFLDFTDDDGTWEVAVSEKAYKDPHELAEALTTAMNSSGTTETHAVTYSDSTGKFTIATSTSTVLSLLWSTGTHGSGGTDTHIGTKLGYSDAADDTGATSYAADNAQSYAAPVTPSYDSADPLAAKAHELLLGDSDDASCLCASTIEFTVSNTKENNLCVCSESGVSGSIINERVVTATVQSSLEQYDADKFKRYRKGDNIKLFYAFGEKSGGNWVAGKSGYIYMPTAVISAISLVDNNGIVDMSLELTAYVNSSGQGEAYIGFL